MLYRWHRNIIETSSHNIYSFFTTLFVYRIRKWRIRTSVGSTEELDVKSGVKQGDLLYHYGIYPERG